MQRSKAVAFLALGLSVVALGSAVYYSLGPGRPTANAPLTAEEYRLRELLKLQGLGLEQPVKVRSFCSSPSEETVQRAGQILTADGFRIVIWPKETDAHNEPRERWRLFADLYIVPSAENLRALRERVKKLIESTGAQYDGLGPPGQP